jgi:parallel beta-helix repeat protein
MKAKHVRPGRLRRLSQQHSISRFVAFLGMFLMLAMIIGPVRSLAQSSSLRLLVSRSPDRSGAVALAGQSLSGPIYVFVSSRGTITEVAFGLDGSTHNVESSRPFDFNGTADGGMARPWSPTAGGHTITAKIALKAGEVRTLSATFSVPVQSSTTTSSSTTTTQATTTTAAPPTTAPTTTTAPAAAAPSCTGLRVPAGSSVQAAIDSNPSGATLCLGTGVHRLARPLAPKAGQRLIGEPGAVLNGAVRVTSFSQTGTTWVARGVVTTTPSTNGVCMPGYSGCKYSEAVFYDNRPLWRVMSLAELSPGEFYQDYATGTLYLADDPSGHEVEVARAKAAIINSASAVTVRGLIVEKFANDAQRGAIMSGSDWTIERNEVRLNHGVGIQTPDAQRVKVLANHVHHNGQLGVSGWRTAGALFEGNELAFNNTAGFYNADWEAGGGKWTESQDLTVRDNRVHDNQAIGLWFDIDTKDVTIEGNRIEANDSDGIRYEISYRATIRGNTITGNGFKEPTGWVNGAGIMISSARDVEVVGNVVDSNLNGIVLRQDNRGSGSLGPYVVENSWVHGNQVIMRRGTSGIASTVSDQSVYTANNRFEDNNYTVVGTDPTNFAWRESELAWTQWQQYGNDLAGSFVRR